MFRNSSAQDQGVGSLQLAWIKGPDYCGTNENIMRLDAGKVTRRCGIDGRIRAAEAGSERQPRPADMMGKEKKAPRQSSECKTKIETHNRQRDKEEEFSETRREGRGKVGTIKAERGGLGV